VSPANCCVSDLVFLNCFLVIAYGFAFLLSHWSSYGLYCKAVLQICSSDKSTRLVGKVLWSALCQNINVLSC
jgi:hypothetical protein